MSDYLLEQFAALRREVAELRAERVTYRAAQATAVDAATAEVDVVLPEGEALARVPGAAGQLLPRVGQWGRLRVVGASVTFEPAGISENAVSYRELDGAVGGDISGAQQRAEQAVADAASAAAAAEAAEATAESVSGTAAAAQTAADEANMAAQQALSDAQAAGTDATAAQTAADAAQAAADQARTAADEAGTVAARADATAAQAAADAAQAIADAAAAMQTAQDAAGQAAQAIADAETAITTANGKNTVTFSPNAPSGSGKRAGDLWWRRNASGVLIGTWEWDGAAWRARTFGDATFDTVSAGKITSGQLGVGVSVNVGDPAGDHVLISGDGQVAAYVDDPVDGTPNMVSRLGRNLGVWDPVTGQLVGLLDQSGHLSVQSASITGGLRIGGTTLAATLWALPKGMVGAGQRIFNPGVSITGEEPLFDTALEVDRRRSYRFHVYNFDHAINNSGSGNNVVYVRVAYDGATPTITSPLVTQWQQTIVNGNGQTFDQSFDWAADVAFDGLPTTQWTRLCRFQFSIGRAGNTGTSLFMVGGPTILIEDIGPTQGSVTTPNPGGQGYGSTAPVQETTAKQRYVMERVANWSRSFTPAGAIRDDPNVYQGYNAASGGDMAGMWGFPDMTAELTGAAIERIDVYLYASHWNDFDGGTAIIGTHAQLGEPGAWSKYETDPEIRVGGWPRAEGRWVGLDVARYAPRLQNGQFRGVTVGRAGTTAGEYYGRFHGAGEINPARIRVEYVK